MQQLPPTYTRFRDSTTLYNPQFLSVLGRDHALIIKGKKGGGGPAKFHRISHWRTRKSKKKIHVNFPVIINSCFQQCRDGGGPWTGPSPRLRFFLITSGLASGLIKEGGPLTKKTLYNIFTSGTHMHFLVYIV